MKRGSLSSSGARAAPIIVLGDGESELKPNERGRAEVPCAPGQLTWIAASVVSELGDAVFFGGTTPSAPTALNAVQFYTAATPTGVVVSWINGCRVPVKVRWALLGLRHV